MISPERNDAQVNEALGHLLAFAKAADSVLRDFGDEYEGRLAPLREALEAYEAWMLAAPSSGKDSK